MKQLLIIFLLSSLHAHTQIITTIAGGGISGLGDGGPATASIIGGPADIAFDATGNMYVSCGVSNRIRKINSLGIITTFAGNGTGGFGGDGGPATAAMFRGAGGIVIDTVGNIYVADMFNYRIRKIWSSGIITTIAGNGILGFNGDGGPATAAMINPSYVILDQYGNIYFNDAHSIAKVTPSGILHVIAGSGGTPGFSGDGGPATAARLNAPGGMAIDLLENIYIADYYNNRIRKVDGVTQIITTIAGTSTYGYTGDGGPATAAELESPSDVAISNNGDIYFSDYNNNAVRKISASGIITTIAGMGIQGFSGDGGPATSAQLYGPDGVTLDSCDNLYIADAHNGRVRKVALNPFCWPESVQNITTTHTINIYPNPANEILYISNIKPQTNFRLLSIVGTVMQQDNLKEGSNSIPLQSLPVGMYIVEVTNNEGEKIIRKIIKQ